MQYNERETSLTTAYLLDQGETDIAVYRNLWSNYQLTMEEVNNLTDTFRNSKDYKDFYPTFSQEYDSVTGRSSMDYFRREMFEDEKAVRQLFYVANERRIRPEVIVKAVPIEDFLESVYYNTHWGKTLERLGQNAPLNQWERLLADTIYFYYKNDVEKNRFITLMVTDDEPFIKKQYAQMLLSSKNDLQQITANYQAAFNQPPPMREAVSRIMSSNSPEEIAGIIHQYQDDEETISDVVNHLLNREGKEEKEDVTNIGISLPQIGISNPQIMSALVLTVYFQQFIGETFGRVSLGTGNHITDKQRTSVINTYLQQIDSEIAEIEKIIADQEKKSEMYKESLEEHRYRLHDLQNISYRGHCIMDCIIANTELRNQLEQDINEGKKSATEVRKVGMELKEAPDMIRNDHFKNLYGYELENLYGRDLSKVDIYIILCYKEFLCSRIDAAEARMKAMTDGELADKPELRNLWKAYVVDTKLLESVNESLNHYQTSISGVTLPGIVQLVYQPDKGKLSIKPTIEIGQLQKNTFIIDPFIDEIRAKEFIQSFTKKYAALGITTPVGYPVMVSEMKCWNSMFQSSHPTGADGLDLPGNLRSDMAVFKEKEKQYIKYIEDVKYDMAHPEFIGVWQTDENYQDLQNLNKTHEQQTMDNPSGRKR